MLVTEHTFAERAERVSRASDMTLDLETSGISPWEGARVVGLAAEVDGEADYFPFRHEAGGNLPVGLLPNLARAAQPRPDRVYRGYNLRFDLTHMAVETGDRGWLDATTQDGIIDALLIDENEPSFALAAIAEKYLGRGASSTKGDMDRLLAERFPKLRSARARKGNLHRLHAAEVEPYACGDVLLPRRLREKYAPAIEAWGLTQLAAEMNDYNLLLARMQYDGVPIDVGLCRRLAETTEARKAVLLDDLRQELGNPKFNPSSWQQVTRLLGTPDAQEETLARLEDLRAQRIIDYKKLGKAKAAYYDAILRLVDAYGVLHPQLNLTRDPSDAGGTKTGRLSCSDPNFQALPHPDLDPNAIYRVCDLVIPPRGYKLAKLDYERAEMWMGASYCRDPKLIEAYHARRDIYTEMAAALGISRQAAKGLFLMTQYGAGAWKIALKMGWTETFAKKVRADFFNLYPNIKRAMWNYADAWEGTGVLRLWTRRACHYPGDRSYAGWNRVIQGAVGEMIRTAMQRLERPLAALGARMILQVHDELLVLYPEENEREVILFCIKEMTDFDQFLLRPRVDVSTSATNYARCEKYTEAL